MSSAPLSQAAYILLRSFVFLGGSLLLEQHSATHRVREACLPVPACHPARSFLAKKKLMPIRSSLTALNLVLLRLRRPGYRIALDDGSVHLVSDQQLQRQQRHSSPDPIIRSPAPPPVSTAPAPSLPHPQTPPTAHGGRSPPPFSRQPGNFDAGAHLAPVADPFDCQCCAAGVSLWPRE